jgi:hypothetical protein
MSGQAGDITSLLTQLLEPPVVWAGEEMRLFLADR